MKNLKIIIYDNGKKIEEINISISKFYIFYSDKHPEIMMHSKDGVIEEIKSRL